MDYSNWEEDVAAYEAHSAPPAPIVFYGSSTMRMWDSLAHDFPHRPVVNRGFGGSNVDEATHFVPRLILPLQPAQVIFYSGENDLAQGKSVPQIRADYERLIQTLRSGGSGTSAPLAIISIKPSWGRWEFMPMMDELNDWLRELCAQDSSLDFINVVDAMLEGGEPRRELWIEDGVHLTPQGYQLWADIVRPHLIQE